MLVHKSFPLSGAYALSTLPLQPVAAVSTVLAGRVRIAAGRRSPETGLRTSAQGEIGYVVRGRLRIDTAHASHTVEAGDMLSMCPAQAHSTTALEDSEIFFVLLNPHAPPA